MSDKQKQGYTGFQIGLIIIGIFAFLGILAKAFDSQETIVPNKSLKLYDQALTSSKHLNASETALEESKTSFEVKEGQVLYSNILARYPKLDKYYQQPSLWGGLTASPMATILVPLIAWEKLTSKERNLLAVYATSLIEIVQSDPLKFSLVPAKAPAAPIISKNALKMDENSWQIMAGRVINNGRDISVDKVVLSGGNATMKPDK